MIPVVYRSTQPACLQVYYHRRERADARDLHEHSDHQIAVTVGGLADVQWWSASRGERRLRAIDGQIMVNPAGERHASEWTGSWERVGFHLDRGFASRVARELGVAGADIRAESNGRDAAVHNLARTLREQIAEDPLSCRLYAETVAQFLAIRLLRGAVKAAPSRRREFAPLSRSTMRALAAFISENVERNLSVSELAALAGLSPFHFSRRFRASNGVTPYQYVMRARVERARELLRNARVPLAEIGYRLGFSSQSHFTSHFGRIVGTTPARYRRALLRA